MEGNYERSRKLELTRIMVKKLMKKEEKVRKIDFVNSRYIKLDDEGMASIMRNIRCLTSLTNISLNFER